MALTAPTMSRPVGVAPVELDQPAPEPGERGAERAGVLLLGALLAAVLYAIFAHGAAPQPEEARLQVGLSWSPSRRSPRSCGGAACASRRRLPPGRGSACSRPSPPGAG